MRITSLLLLVALASACGGSVDARDYGQGCAVDADCVAVFSGQLCGACGACANAAISASSYARYTADVAAIACAPRPVGLPCPMCQEPAAACNAGVCVLSAAR
jgi:hypothetical protein